MASKWQPMRLGAAMNLKRGYDLPSQSRVAGPVPIVSSSGVSGSHNVAKVRGPGVVTGRYGTIGQVHFIEGEFWPLNTTLYVEDFKGNHPRFVKYLLGTIDFQQFSDKAAVPGINRNHLHEANVLIPPFAEQVRIAEMLAMLEKRIDLVFRTNATLEAIAQALFKSWFVDFDPVRAKVEGREPEGMDAATAALFPGEFEDSKLGLIPKGWQVTEVGEVAELIKGCSYKGAGLSESEGSYMFNLGCFNARRMFATENIKRYTLGYRERQSVVAGDLIMANTDMTQQRNILGRALFVPAGCEPAFVSHHVFKVAIRRVNADEWKRWLFFAFQQAAFRERAVGYATGTTVLALARDSAEQCPVIEPDQKVLAAFDATISPLLAQISNNIDQANRLEGLREALLPRLVSGKLRLPEAEAMPA